MSNPPAGQETASQYERISEAMLNAARDWSASKYGKPIGNEAAIGCYTVMRAAMVKGQGSAPDASEEIERAYLHGPDVRTLDALRATHAMQIAAENDFLRVHNNCIEARAELAAAKAQLAEAQATMTADYSKYSDAITRASKTMAELTAQLATAREDMKEECAKLQEAEAAELHGYSDSLRESSPKWQMKRELKACEKRAAAIRALP